jgi:hypothetical protein
LRLQVDSRSISGGKRCPIIELSEAKRLRHFCGWCDISATGWPYNFLHNTSITNLLRGNQLGRSFIDNSQVLEKIEDNQDVFVSTHSGGSASTSPTFSPDIRTASTRLGSDQHLPELAHNDHEESLHLQWKVLLDSSQHTSPGSTISSTTGLGHEVTPIRWFDLLAGDATANDEGFSVDLLSWMRAVGTPQTLGPNPISTATDLPVLGLTLGESVSLATPTAPIQPPASLPSIEKEPWQISISLRDHEIPIFRRFVDRLSLWLDLFDPMQHFSSLVPHLAMANEGLMKAILALSARHFSIQPASDGMLIDRTAAVQYYYETIRYLQTAMKYESYTHSQELIATALIVSMYEMVDGASKGWERHLKGVFWIQRSRNIGAESPGLEGAGWWSWLRQDVWAAFRERRRVYSFHRPTKQYADMTQFDLASRAVYLLAQTVNYCSEAETKEGASNLHVRIDRARMLLDMLDEWRRNSSIHFQRLPLASDRRGPFEPIWINPSPLGTAVQMHHFARTLLLVTQPAPGGFGEFLLREEQLSEAVDAICGIAMTITDEPSLVSSTQCLFAAGLYTHDKDPRKREAIMQLIDAHQMRTGWPVHSLSQELQAEWTIGDSKSQK